MKGARNNAPTSEKLFYLKFSAKSGGNSSNICYFQENCHVTISIAIVS